MSLDFTQEGILRKDDCFKVVFNPGADKREKGILGQIILDSALVCTSRLWVKLLTGEPCSFSGVFSRAEDVRTRVGKDTGGAGLALLPSLPGGKTDA